MVISDYRGFGNVTGDENAKIIEAEPNYGDDGQSSPGGFVIPTWLILLGAGVWLAPKILHSVMSRPRS